MRLGNFECEICFCDTVEDSFVECGYGVNTGRVLTELECGMFTDEYQEEIAEAWNEHMIGRAEQMADLASDR